MAKYRGRAPKSRARLIEINAKLGCGDGAEPSEIIAAVKQKHPHVIRAERDDLIYLGLASILNAVCNLKGVAGNGLQPSLFKGFGDLPLTLTVRNGTRNMKKNFDAATKADVAQYLEDHPDKPPKPSKRTTEVRRFFERYGKYGDKNSTMKQCWDAGQAGGAAGAR
jgi:hypothetical protein